MLRDRRPWLRMYLRVSAALGFLACAEPLEIAEAPGAASSLALASSGNRLEARSAAPATLLLDGRVLLAGGEGSNGSVSSAEVYDPATGTWSPTGAMLLPRSLHTATLLPTGKVLVVGGLSPSGVLAAAELYDPATGRWTATGSLRMARYGHTAMLLPGGQVLIMGGYTSSGATGSAEVYDPATGSWTWSHTNSLATGVPDTFILDRPSNPTNQTSATFTFAATDASATFECKLGPTSSFSPCTSPITYSGLAAGSYTFQVRAKDATGNVDTTPDSYTWTIDRVAPDTTITAQPPNPSNSTSATFTFDSNEATVSFECKLDTAASFTTCTSPTSFSGLAGGIHTLQVRAIDAAGNVDASPASYTWAVDTAAPNTFITSPPPDPNNATFTFTSNEAPVTFECKLDAEAFSPCTSPVTLPPMTDGSHTFQVRARDAAGNVDPAPASYTWVVDTTPPDTTIASQPLSPTNSTSATFTFSSDDPTVTFECKLDAEAFTPCTSPKTYVDLAEGSHTFSVRARDAAGNVDPTPPSYTWVVDTTPPDIILTTHPRDPSISTSATFTFSSNDPTASFECSLDGLPFASCSSPKTYVDLAEGSHTFSVRARDAADNVTPTPPSFTWMVDVTPPDAVITTRPSNPTNSTSATFTFSSDDPTATFECKLDAEDFTPCTSPKTYVDLAEGSHTFSVRARDAAGNATSTPPIYTWVVDTTPPDIILTTHPRNPSISTSATFTFTSNETPVTFECKLDAEDFTPCTSPKTYFGLAEGSHTFSVRARDAAGNITPTPPSFTWMVDVTPPDTVIAAQPSNPTSSTDAMFTFSGAGAGGGFECALDAAAFSACSSPMVYADLADGLHTFQVRARDAAGNVDPTPASYSWTVDTTVPDTTITAQPPTSTRETSARFAFSSEEGAVFECSLDETPFEVCTSPWDYAELAEGVHTFQVRAKDTAGNADPTPASHAWTVDLTAPDTTLILKPADPSHTDSAVFSFTSNESDVGFECKRDEATAFTSCPSPMEYTGLTEGPHTFQVRAMDAAGNTDVTPASFSWAVDARPPEAPAIQSPAQGATITQRQPPISGTAQPASTVALRLDGAPLGTTTADSLGQWTLTPDSQLEDGPHTVTATARDGAGTSAPSAPVSFTIEASGPPDGGDDDPGGGGCGCGAGSADASLLLWGLGLLATLGARRRARPTLNHP